MENAKSNIFCPNCGANNKTEQSFCRFCGFNLADSIKSLKLQFSTAEKKNKFKKLESIKKISDYSKIIAPFVLITGVLVFALTDFGKNGFFGQKSFISAMFFLFLFSQSVLNYLRRKTAVGFWEESVQKRVAANKELKNFETEKLLEDRPFEPISSVTKNSTEHAFR